MTDDIDTRLRRALPPDPTDESMQELLARARQRVDTERRHPAPPRGHRLRPRTRLGLVAAAAAVITAVPVVASVVGEDGGRVPSVLPVAVAGNGELVCGAGYASIVAPAQAQVRLLPDRLPAGWAYTEISARHERSQGCHAESLVALRLDPTGVVGARVAVSGPVDAHVDGPLVDRDSVPDAVFGAQARRFDYAPDTDPFVDVEVHRWVWTDDTGLQWSAEVVGLGLADARRQLTGVTIDGAAVTWAGVDPGWTLVHRRTGAPYVVPTGGTIWTVALTGGVEGHGFDVYTTPEPHLPVAADAYVGDRLTTVDGHDAVVSPPRGGEADGGAPGSSPLVTIALDVAPGVAAFSRTQAGDVTAVEHLLASLRQVPADDPRIEEYGTS